MRFFSCLLLLFLSAQVASAQPEAPLPVRPSPPRFVNDFAHILTGVQAAQLEKKLRDYEKTDGKEILLITMDSTAADNAAYAGKILNNWQVGSRDEGKGMLLLVDMKHRKVNTAISPELHKTLLDATCLRIINQDIVPAFEQGQYYKGLDQALNGLKIVMIPLSVLQNASGPGNHRLILEVIVILILVTGYFYFFIYRKPKKR